MIEAIQLFCSKTRDVPPTATDIFTLVRGMGWSIRVKADGQASLKVPDAKDPIANKVARILRREPWRSEVLAMADESTVAAKPEELVTKEPNYSDRVRANPPTAPATQAA